MSTQKGDRFRDVVADLLRAAGFSGLELERKIKFKRADIATTWLRHTIDGPIRYAIETKDYKKSVPLDECSIFCAQYGELIKSGTIDRAWMISRGAISPDGRNQIRSTIGRNLDCLTFAELQRKLLLLDGYLADVTEQYRISGIGEYYVAPRLVDNSDLEAVIMTWLDDAGAKPLAIVGAYGQGKSTFALYLANKLIELGKKNPATRMPILIPLGEIVDEQSVEGLVGKLLASHHRVENYHFHLFSALNQSGRFVVIFDGFDEMKHGMTLEVFKSNFNALMNLDRGKAKLIILGRHTVFQDDKEFKSIILGRDFTLAGQEVASKIRRPCVEHEIVGFSPREAASFIQRYFRFKIASTGEDRSELANEKWIERRIKDLCAQKYEELTSRPVHARMLCELAIDADFEFDELNKFELYDAFIHHLFAREVSKKGRYKRFTVDHRRRFNRAVAWWLWEQGALSTASFATLPLEICTAATEGIPHDFDEEGLKRELVSGCLVEKRRGAVFFPHRSIQEFLVSEHIWDDIFSSELLRQRVTTEKLTDACDQEVVNFISGRIRLDRRLGKDVSVKIELLLKVLDRLVKTPSRVADLLPFVELLRLAEVKDVAIYEKSHLGFHLGFFAVNGRISYLAKEAAAIQFIKDMARRGFSAINSDPANIIYLWLQVVIHNWPQFSEKDVVEFLFNWLPLTTMDSDRARRARGVNDIIARDDVDERYRRMLLDVFLRQKIINERITIFWEPLLIYLKDKAAGVLCVEDVGWPASSFNSSIECNAEDLYERIRLDRNKNHLLGVAKNYFARGMDE